MSLPGTINFVNALSGETCATFQRLLPCKLNQDEILHSIRFDISAYSLLSIGTNENKHTVETSAPQGVPPRPARLHGLEILQQLVVDGSIEIYVVKKEARPCDLCSAEAYAVDPVFGDGAQLYCLDCLKQHQIRHDCSYCRSRDVPLKPVSVTKKAACAACVRSLPCTDSYNMVAFSHLLNKQIAGRCVQCHHLGPAELSTLLKWPCADCSWQ